MDPFSVLARLARQALDGERQGVLETDQAILVLSDQLVALHQAAERERRAADWLADGNGRLVAYLRRISGRAAVLDANLGSLEQQREVRAARLAACHMELKRLEILLQRRAERVGVERRRREQKAIDELAAIRQRHGPPLTP